MNEQTKQIVNDIQKYKGNNFVVLCAIEEMAELIQALLKNINRGKKNRDNILEEMGGVTVCLEHLKMIYGISEKELWDYENNIMYEKWMPKIEKWKAEENR